MAASIAQINSNLKIIFISRAGEIFDYLNDTSSVKNFYFTNWVDSTNFPFVFGSGMVFCGLDARLKYVIYFVENGIFFAFYKTDEGKKTLTWNKCTFTS